MVTGKKRVNLTIEALLERVSEYDIYREFMGEDFTLGKVCHSPMPGRRDTHPSFCIRVIKGGQLMHIDYADSRFRGGCINFVMQKEMCNYNDALKKVDVAFNLGISTTPHLATPRVIYPQPDLKEARPTFIQVEYGVNFSEEDLAYWAQFHITKEELGSNEIYKVNRYLINRQLQRQRKGELIFGYKLGNHWKIYRPLASKELKWKNNIPIDAVEGINNLKQCKKGIVTKSRKDRIVLRKFLPEVCSVQNESMVALNEETVTFLRGNCSEIYLNYDSDPPGKENSWLVTTEFGFKHLNVPDRYLAGGIKDFSDLSRSHGLEAVENHLKEKHII